MQNATGTVFSPAAAIRRSEVNPGGAVMPAALSSEVVRQRLLDFPRDNYLYIGSFMKSVVFAAATIVLLEILAGFQILWPRLIPWLASLLGAMVTYLSWARGTLLTNSRANLGDVVFPLLLGIAEFCLFAVLSPRAVDGNIWRWWLIVLGFHALLAFGLVHNRIRTIRQTDFAAEMQELAVELIRWIKTDRKEAAIGAGLAFILGSVALGLPLCRIQEPLYSITYDILSLPFVFVFGYVSWRCDQQRQAVDEYIFKKLEMRIE